MASELIFLENGTVCPGTSGGDLMASEDVIANLYGDVNREHTCMRNTVYRTANDMTESVWDVAFGPSEINDEDMHETDYDDVGTTSVEEYLMELWYHDELKDDIDDIDDDLHEHFVQTEPMKPRQRGDSHLKRSEECHCPESRSWKSSGRRAQYVRERRQHDARASLRTSTPSISDSQPLVGVEYVFLPVEPTSNDNIDSVAVTMSDFLRYWHSPGYWQSLDTEGVAEQLAVDFDDVPHDLMPQLWGSIYLYEDEPHVEHAA